MAEALLAHVVKRGTIKGRLTRGEVGIVAAAIDGDAESFTKVSKFLTRVEASYEEFETVQASIELLDKETDHEVEKANFDELYYRVVAACESFLSKNRPKSNPPNANSNFPANNRIKLPTINIPTFSGAYQEWLPFRDTFESLVHNNTEITNVEKLQYLRSCLTGEAADTIRTLSTTHANYTIAWETVTRQFGNQKLIVRHHINALIDTKAIVKVTASALRELQNHIRTNLQVLKSLNLPTDKWDALVVHLMMPKLDFVSRREWEAQNKADIPVLDELLEFLKMRAQILESLECARHPVKPESAPTAPRKYTHQRVAANVCKTKTTSRSCPVCDEQHFLNQCPTFLQLVPTERVKRVRSLNLCGNCLKRGHFANSCTSGVCRACFKRHHTLTHLPSSTSAASNTATDVTTDIPSLRIEAAPFNPEQSTSTHSVNTSVSVNNGNRVLLSTSLVAVIDANGRGHQLRALIDSGSQTHFLTERARARLRLPSKPTDMAVVGIGQQSKPITNFAVTTIKSNHSTFSAAVSCLIVESITENVPAHTFNAEPVKIPHGVALADPNFNFSAPVDMLIGAGLYYEILTGNIRHLGAGLPWLQETKLGWLIGGPISAAVLARNEPVKCHFTTLDAQVERFWEIEENHSPSEKRFSAEEAACERQFQETTRRDTTGRFEVQLPFREGAANVGNSKPMASSRLRAMERKFKRDPNLKAKYVAFMKEYKKLGHMSLVRTRSELDHNSECYYLPHHAVFKTTEAEPKIRVVFDGSCRPCDGPSLNDNLMTGPVIQQDLFSILIRFRIHTYVFSCDVVKMYRQVNVAPAHRAHQLILWREDELQPVKVYELNTVTYGLAPSSFLAIRCLKQLAIEAESRFPRASEVITRDMFVDDVLTGSESLADALQLKTDLTNVMAEAGFQLCKWAANHATLVPTDDSENRSVLLNFDSEGNTKTLGQRWNCSIDCFNYDFRCETLPKKLTKRTMLSRIAQLYDPLGLLGPVIIRGKLLLQKLWAEKVGWDEPVCRNLSDSFLEFIQSLNDLNQIQIPRRVTGDGKIVTRELHGFCDASEGAFGACIFVKTTNEAGDVSCKLLCAKSRVAPLKTVTLPRLELCGAVLLTRLTRKTIATLNCDITRSYHWTDLTIVLAWLRTQPSALKTFVANRVSEIQSGTRVEDWRHCRSAENPADIISRGMYPRDLAGCALWWQGPAYLRSDSLPETSLADLPELPEQRVRALPITIAPEWPLLTKYSKFVRLQRILAWTLRFVGLCRKRSNERSEFLTARELQDSTRKIAKLVQTVAFRREIAHIVKFDYVDNRSPLKSLDPFLDSERVLRVGGRLRNSTLNFNHKHPILLPQKHHVTRLLIEREHQRQLHAGPQATLNGLRQQFWIINGRSTVRHVIRKCQICFRVAPQFFYPFMGDLPAVRVTPARPFLNTGVDYAGPVNLREGRGRGKRTVKAYIAVFVCMCTKALHLEVVSDATADSFLAAFRRFISRRGNVLHVYSDNGAAFVKANKDLKELQQLFRNQDFKKGLHETLGQIGTNWHFIPARSAHFGGLWESGVKSVKGHLRKMLGNATNTFEELCTILTQIEACLNSRPLSPLSDDPNDLSALSPSHFLIGEPLTAVAEPDLLDVSENRLSRWQQVQKTTQHFWKRWQREYLHKLQQRTKWQRRSSHPFEIGTLVVLQDDNLPPLQWRLGRIEELHHGNDGIPRVATVRTTTGTVRRAIVKLAALPSPNEDDGAADPTKSHTSDEQ